MSALRLGILGSTRGTNMQAIIEAIRANHLAASIQVVISNKEKSGILDKARAYHLPAIFLDPATLTRDAYDTAVSTVLLSHSVELILLMGYMRILSSAFVQTWQHNILNVHPSLLPAFAGGMDQDVHQAVIDSGATQSGCTIHYVTEEIDAGPILWQKQCVVLPHDTPMTLKARVQMLEAQAWIATLQHLVRMKHEST